MCFCQEKNRFSESSSWQQNKMRSVAGGWGHLCECDWLVFGNVVCIFTCEHSTVTAIHLLRDFLKAKGGCNRYFKHTVSNAEMFHGLKPQERPLQEEQQKRLQLFESSFWNPPCLLPSLELELLYDRDSRGPIQNLLRNYLEFTSGLHLTWRTSGEFLRLSADFFMQNF